jgi:hypothetical protein
MCAEQIDVLPNDRLSTAVTVGLDRPWISSPSLGRPFSRSTSLHEFGVHVVLLAIVLIRSGCELIDDGKKIYVLFEHLHVNSA